MTVPQSLVSELCLNGSRSQQGAALSRLDHEATILRDMHHDITELKTLQATGHQFLAAGLSSLSHASRKETLELRRHVQMLESGLLSSYEAGNKSDTQLGRSNTVSSALDLQYPVPKLFAWRWINYRSPVGRLTLGLARRSVAERGECGSGELLPELYEIELSYETPSWISNNIIRLTRQARQYLYGHVGFKWSLTTESYNSHPLLIEAINSGNITMLENLFSQRLARPTDLIAPRGRSLLHVSRITPSTDCIY